RELVRWRKLQKLAALIVVGGVRWGRGQGRGTLSEAMLPPSPIDVYILNRSVKGTLALGEVLICPPLPDSVMPDLTHPSPPPAKQLRFPLPSLVFFLFVYKVFCIQKVKREYLHMEIGEGGG